ncbi:hypothetical protein [Cesiribacter sp. SM1]|uniref:hypothetical protein n=1 Tax=Cesiribacter sp. SM1 TaxID=2861196 RepID=UPI001CD4E361|nr:hypothetical protein [Cesiribacter sp. SM1]
MIALKRLTLFVSLELLFTMCNSWEPDYEHAHPNAKALMTDDFLWSPLEPSSPFGNDDGADAVWQFYEWRKNNQNTRAKEFIPFLLTEWNYKTYDYTQVDTVAIKEFIVSGNIGDRLYMGIDDVIIATGFGQLIMEGKIDADLKSLTLIALNRQLLPISLSLVNEEYRNTRESQLQRMIKIINAA